MSDNIEDEDEEDEMLTLTEEEKGWAMTIKNAIVEADAEFAKTITDLEYVQHAIVAKDKLSRALKRIRRLKEFKREYGIDDHRTMEEIQAILLRFEELASGFFLGFGREESGRYVVTVDYKCFEPQKFESPEDWKVLFAGFYYMLEATQPDITSVRAGMTMICESKGIAWKNFSMEIEKRGAALYQDAYPVRIKEMSILNAPAIMRVMYLACQPFLGKRIKEVLHMDATLSDVQQRVKRDNLPTTMGGVQGQLDMSAKMFDSLKIRAANKANFTL
jgi:hypothetical protein